MKKNNLTLIDTYNLWYDGLEVDYLSGNFDLMIQSTCNLHCKDCSILDWKGNEYPAKDMMLVWHLSLTSHKNEGELEFKYYDKRIEPKAGRLIMWPAGFTHTHRGNCIRSDTQKHYMTGWWFSGRIR